MSDTASVNFASADAALEAARAARHPAGSQAELQAAEAAARMAPDRSDVWVALGAAATRLGMFDRAEEAQLRALETAADPLLRARLMVDRGWNLANQRRFAEALEYVRQPKPEVENEPLTRNILGATLLTIGRGAEALPHLEFAARSLPDRPDILLNLAVTYNALGRTDDAEAQLEKIVSFAPGYLPAYEMLSELRTARPGANQVDRLLALRSRARPGLDSIFLDFALFKQFDDLDRRAEAWPVLTRANEAKRTVKPWSQARDEAFADGLRRMASGLAPSTAEPSGPRSIFIVSLPRTGSTLVERIFAAHPSVRALGELETFNRAMKKAAGLPPHPILDPRLADAGPIDWNAVGEAYRREVTGLAEGAPVVTDKMPLNWWFSPMIAAALPDATILHVRREPMDALFGAYKLSFAEAFSWAYSFEDLAAHYRVYRGLMADWKEAIGDRLAEVDYEALVMDAESVAPQMLAACGLGLDEACLSPHLSEGTVSTPSAAQVRQPITATKIGNWRRYAAELEPLRALLQRDGWVDADGNGIR